MQCRPLYQDTPTVGLKLFTFFLKKNPKKQQKAPTKTGPAPENIIEFKSVVQRNLEFA